MKHLFQGFEFIRVYIYELQILTEGPGTDHLQKLELTLNKLKESGLKFNIETSFFEIIQMEYLGFQVTRDSVESIYMSSRTYT